MGLVAWQSTTLKVIGDLRLIWDCKFWSMMIFQWRRKIVAKPEKGFLKCHQDFVQTNKSIIAQIENILTKYFAETKVKEQGLPTVKFLADHVHLSPSYLSDLLKKSSTAFWKIDF